VRDRGEQALVQPQAPLGEPPRVTRRTEVPPLAAERHQKLGAAGGAAHAGEAVLEQAAVEQPADRPTRRRTQRAVHGLEALLVYPLERREVIGQHAVERRGLRAPRQVGVRAACGASRRGRVRSAT